jgi:tryptophan synthase alpha chain
MISKIAQVISERNKENQLALSIFLTAGFPQKENFTDKAYNILVSGADILEIGIPFSDPIADGPVIQKSSQIALENGITIKDVFSFTSKIKSRISKPVILMGYANPLLQYSLPQFLSDAKNSGVDGLIIPDIPLDEDAQFWPNLERPDRILLTTPTSALKRIQEIDQKSEGFVYCVSVTGTTGDREGFDKRTMDNLAKTYKNIKKNKMLIGFGISSPIIIKQLKGHCDGVIIGSAIIRLMLENSHNDSIITDFTANLRNACDV